jgi:hypothetical protein
LALIYFPAPVFFVVDEKVKIIVKIESGRTLVVGLIREEVGLPKNVALTYPSFHRMVLYNF